WFSESLKICCYDVGEKQDYHSGNPQLRLLCRFVMPDQPLTWKLGNLTRGCVHPIGCSVAEPDSTLAPPQCESVLTSLVPVSAGHSPPCEIWTDAEIFDAIHRTGPADQDYTTLMDSASSPASQCSNPKLSKYS
ncbi:uncharacterized protein VP01_12491g1, partial [Puccinia sorghi]